MSGPPPRVQLGLLPGFESAGDSLALVTEADRLAETMVRPARKVSAEREMLAAQGSLAVSVDPPEIQGWREELGHERPRIGPDGRCTAIDRWRRRADGSIGPCPWFGCPRNLTIDSGAPVEIGGRRYAELLLNRAGQPATMGRRPALPAVPTDGEADAFALDAIARYEELPDTCSIDVQERLGKIVTTSTIEEQVGGVETEAEEDWAEEVAARRALERQHADAMQVQAIAQALGVSVEEIRQYTISGAAKLGVRLVNGQPLPGDGARVAALLAQVDGRRAPVADDDLRMRARRVLEFLGAPAVVGQDPAAAVERVLLTDTSPPPRIRRIERDAPPPREPTADEIFGGEW